MLRAGRVPLVAIGGITIPTAGLSQDAGAACIASIGELCGAADPEMTARAFATALGAGTPLPAALGADKTFSAVPGAGRMGKRGAEGG